MSGHVSVLVVTWQTPTRFRVSIFSSHRPVANMQSGQFIRVCLHCLSLTQTSRHVSTYDTEILHTNGLWHLDFTHWLQRALACESRKTAWFFRHVGNFGLCYSVCICVHLSPRTNDVSQLVVDAQRARTHTHTHTHESITCVHDACIDNTQAQIVTCMLP
jgi:hypothetical protein